MNAIKQTRVELAQGRLWRAKEIMQGTISNSPFSPDEYELYGEVLLRMGDLPEAGRYLFLSGRRKSEYEESIELFLQKLGNRPWHSFFGLYNAQARFPLLSAYPEAVADTLRAKGFPGELKPYAQPRPPVQPESRWFGVFCYLTVAGVILVFVLGLLKLWELIFHR